MALLPIAEYKNQIINTIKENQVTIIVADTGAGKSTQVPQYLLEAGYEVVVTQPRRLAARTVAERVASEWGGKFGDIVAFRTAMERNDSKNTRCLFVTDGLALIRELLGIRKPNTILVIDEVHEWNLNIEVLVAYAKWLIQENSSVKIVLMSATVESDKLSAYFNNAPVINVPGRLYPIEDRNPRSEMFAEVSDLLRQGRNVLVFQPGKGEIGRMINDLLYSTINAEILPLHSELSSAEQAMCFKSYKRPKCVVATNVAQTSITIDDIDAVVDSGMERRTELADNVEGLYLKPISFADSKQRRGRAGRCRQGIYIDYCPNDDRREFAEAEIHRTLLDQTVLRLAKEGFNAETLEFFHQPDRQAIHQAKESLRLIGCMDENDRVSRIGEEVAKLPVSVKYGRMLVEAKRLGVVGDILTIISILEVGGITNRKNPFWQTLCQRETDSDLLAQLMIYKASIGQNNGWLADNGVHMKSLRKAQKIRGHIYDGIRHDVKVESTGNRKDILRAIAAGLVEHVFRKVYNTTYLNGKGPGRRLNNESVVSPRNMWLVGIPFDLNTVKGETINLITMATAVTPELLVEVAPQLVREEKHLSPTYDVYRDQVVSVTKRYFANHLLDERTVIDRDHPDAAVLKTSALNEHLWHSWRRPVGTIIRPAVGVDEHLAQVTKVIYGRCKVTGERLFAYGTLICDPFLPNHLPLKEEWTRDPKEADGWKQNTDEWLKTRKQSLKDANLMSEFASIESSIRELWQNCRRDESVDGPTIEKVRQFYFAVTSYSVSEKRTILEETKNKLEELKALIAAAKQIKPKPATLQSTGKLGLTSFADLQ